LETEGRGRDLIGPFALATPQPGWESKLQKLGFAGGIRGHVVRSISIGSRATLKVADIMRYLCHLLPQDLPISNIAERGNFIR
jgi:hypothetical protein